MIKCYKRPVFYSLTMQGTADFTDSRIMSKDRIYANRLLVNTPSPLLMNSKERCFELIFLKVYSYLIEHCCGVINKFAIT